MVQAATSRGLGRPVASRGRAAARFRVRGERGAELVEFAFALPMLLLVFGGIVDFGLLLQRQQVLTNAAREGARLAILPGYQVNDYEVPKQRVVDFVRTGLNDPALAPLPEVNRRTLTPASGPPFAVAEVQVTLNDRFLILGPIVRLAGGTGSFGTITLTATSTMRVELGSAGS